MKRTTSSSSSAGTTARRSGLRRRPSGRRPFSYGSSRRSEPRAAWTIASELSSFGRYKTYESGRMDVLLVDDSDVVRSSIGRLIHAKTTFRVIAEAGDGLEALEVLKTVRPDVVVTDVKMPNMDGIELTREIKRRYPFIHVLALTSVPDDSTSEAMRDAGASGFIAKGDPERLNYALYVTSTIGSDRRRADRARAIDSIWDPSSVPSN